MGQAADAFNRREKQHMSYANWIRSLTVRSLVAGAAGLALLAGAASAADPGQDSPGAVQDSPGAVYVLSNQSTANSVLVYRRDSNGSLAYSNSFPTGGTGAGTGSDPLSSQGSLTLGSGLLFAVNAGSNDVLMFAVTGTELVLLDKVPSGGQKPVSVAVNRFYVYVVNAGGTPNISPNISGFLIDTIGGHLVPLRNSQPLAGGALAMPGDIHFNADGSPLRQRRGNATHRHLSGYFLGYASGPISHHSSGVTPFGFSVTNRGYAIVSEAGSNAASSYEIDENGELKLVSGSVALVGQNAPCWLVTTRDGRYAYTANAGSGTISSLGIAPDGVLSLLNRAAATLAAPLDLAMTGNSKFLYVREGTGAVAGFQVAPDGRLTLIGFWTGLPAGAQGIAAR
jgi:6-phosphogluconolactonase